MPLVDPLADPHAPAHVPAHATAAPDTDDAALAEVARALAHPARLRILRLLADTPGCIGGEIVDAVGLAQSTVSEHLRILKAAGLIAGEIAGPRVCYALAPGGLDAMGAFLAGIAARAATQTGADAPCCTPKKEPEHGPV